MISMVSPEKVVGTLKDYSENILFKLERDISELRKVSPAVKFDKKISEKLVNF